MLKRGGEVSRERNVELRDCKCEERKAKKTITRKFHKITFPVFPLFFKKFGNAYCLWKCFKR